MQVHMLAGSIQVAIAEKQHAPDNSCFAWLPDFELVRSAGRRQIERVHFDPILTHSDGVEIVSTLGRYPLCVRVRWEMCKSVGVGCCLTQYLVFIRVEPCHCAGRRLAAAV